MMVRNDDYVEQQKETLDAGWKAMEDRLQGPENPFTMAEDGNPNAACIALCSVAGAILFPENQFHGGSWKPTRREDVAEGLKDISNKYRETVLGKFILDIYKEKRTAAASS